MNNALVEVIKEGEIVKMPEWQARQEELFILRKIPEIIDYTDVTKAESPKQIFDPSYKYKRNQSLLDSWKRRDSYKRNNVINELIENFHWQIIKVRRGRGLTRKQFADALGEKEEKLKIIENGMLPEDNFSLVTKIEKYLNINIRKIKNFNEVNLVELQKNSEEKARIEGDKKESYSSKISARDAALFGSDIEVID